MCLALTVCLRSFVGSPQPLSVGRPASRRPGSGSVVRVRVRARAGGRVRVRLGLSSSSRFKRQTPYLPEIYLSSNYFEPPSNRQDDAQLYLYSSSRVGERHTGTSQQEVRARCYACTWLVFASARFPSAFSSTMATSRSCPTTTSTAKTYRSPQSRRLLLHRADSDFLSRLSRKRASIPELLSKKSV